MVRTDHLLTMSSLLLEQGATTEELAGRLQAASGVADVAFDKITVWFRVEGGVPVFVLADPTEGGLLEGAIPPIDDSRRAPSEPPAGADRPTFTGCPAVTDTRSDGIKGTVGEAGKPKKALILGPWKWQMDWDVETLVATLQLGKANRYKIPGNEIEQVMSTYDRPSIYGINAPAVRLLDFCGWEAYETIILKTHGRTICGGANASCKTALSVGRFAETRQELFEYAGTAAGVTFSTSRYGNLKSGLTAEERRACIDRLSAETSESGSPTLAPGAIATNSPSKDCLEALVPTGHMSITTDFFLANYPDGLKDRLIFFSACQGMKAGDLATALRGSGDSGGAILGFDEIIETSVANDVLEEWAVWVANGDPIDEAALKRLNNIVDDAHGNANVAGQIEGDFTSDELADVVPAGSETTRGTDIVSLESSLGGPELADGGRVKIEGRAGDSLHDKLKLFARLTGVGDEGPDVYDLQILLDDRQLTLENYDWVPADRDGAFQAEIVAVALQDFAPDTPFDLEIRTVLPDTGGAFSRWRYEDMEVGGVAEATISIGGQTWEFVLLDGFFGCNFTDDDTELNASGSVDGAYEVMFSAFLHPFGVGTRERLLADNVASIRVTDDINHQIWIADATDPGGFNAALEAIPGGSSQVDTLTIEDGRAWGTATFIERGGVFDAWSNHTPLPAPVAGTFDITCSG